MLPGLLKLNLTQKGAHRCCTQEGWARLPHPTQEELSLTQWWKLLTAVGCS